jgi:ABC-type sugar transport system substrate-binding protein
MGEMAAQSLIKHLNGETPEKEVLVPVLIVTSTNIDKVLPEARKNVFGETE